MKIGILALQGNYSKHEQLVLELGWDCINVKYLNDFSSIDGLIIPGGESTTITKLLIKTNLFQQVKEFAKSYPILGTCAGLILMGTIVSDNRINPLGLLNIKVNRNAYGRQIHSFTGPLDILDKSEPLMGTFIRAPKIYSVGSQVEVIANYKDEPVAVRQGKHIGLTFHPELNREPYFHLMAFSNQYKKISNPENLTAHVH
ncbi:MAG: pyridoxal 5'-phosphate synthase glutaminase subunit PdxT [Candidatus Marinimicrobia bacterium]|nr:pyridoxal 5'-phosphate synthase glutaminase subunit PdxT [Candidatus Neomarinimicrobiota bacterium]|tara:strand:- start:64575 stop:65177 length:603 start_codon:yes stop_codon:yes gene_type:complete